MRFIPLPLANMTSLKRGADLLGCWVSQMTTVLKNIAKKEKFHLPSEVAAKIIEESNGNLRKAILVFEALKMQSCVAFPCRNRSFSPCSPAPLLLPR